MRKSFHPMEAPALALTPPLIVWMSFQRAIPWRFALQHGPPPLRPPPEVYNRPVLLGIENQPTVTRPYFRCLRLRVHFRGCCPGFPGFPGFPLALPCATSFGPTPDGKNLALGANRNRRTVEARQRETGEFLMDDSRHVSKHGD